LDEQNYIKFGEDISRLSKLIRNVLDFRYVTLFRNQNESNTTDVENLGKISDFLGTMSEYMLQVQRGTWLLTYFCRSIAARAARMNVLWLKRDSRNRSNLPTIVQWHRLLRTSVGTQLPLLTVPFFLPLPSQFTSSRPRLEVHPPNDFLNILG